MAAAESPVHELWRDPRVVSISVAVGLMLFDDMPRYRYGTGHDPGGAAVVSILFAHWCGLLVSTATSAPKWIQSIVAVLAVTSAGFFGALKGEAQFLLWIRNADIIDPLVLWAGCLVIAVAYVSWTRRWRRLPTVFISVPLALGVSLGLGLLAASFAHEAWRSAWPDFVLLTACRVLVPYIFWTMLIPRPGSSAVAN